MSETTPPVYSREFQNKRKLMTFIPVVGVPFLMMLFWAGDGGAGVAVAAAPPTVGGGINLNLPTAHTGKLYDSKMDAYKAPADNKSQASLAFTVNDADTLTTSGGTTESDGAGTGLNGLNYGLKEGETKVSFEPAPDPNLVAVQTSMQKFKQAQQGSSLPPSYGAAPGYGAPAYGPSAAYGAPNGYPAGGNHYGGSYGGGSYGGSGYGGGSYAPAASPSHEREYETAMKDMDRMRDEYQRRLNELNRKDAPAPAAPVAAATEPAEAAANTTSVVSSVPTSVVTTLATPKGKPVALATTQTANGFHSIGAPDARADVNAIPAVIHTDQTVISGSSVKMRLLQDVLIEGRVIPRNSFVYGICGLNGQRLTITITSLQYQNSIVPVKLNAFDLDGAEGLYIPGSLNRDAVKQGAATGLSGADMLTMSPNLGAQAAGVIMQTGKSLVGKQIKQVKVNLKANYNILLK